MAKKTASNLSGSNTNENVSCPITKQTLAIPAKGEPNPDKFYWWTVRLGVNATWVADGFDLDDDRAHDMLCHHLPHAMGTELCAEVLHAPNPAEVAGEQGFKTVEDADIKPVDYSARRRTIHKKAEAVTNLFADHLDSSGQNTVEMRQTLTNRLQSMVELALCEMTGVPWEAPMRKATGKVRKK